MAMATIIFVIVVLSLTTGSANALSASATTSMIRGAATFMTMRAKDAKAATTLTKLARDRVASATSFAPVRATLVTEGNNVVLVEEWSSGTDHAAYVQHVKEKSEIPPMLDDPSTTAALVAEPITCEYFPEALHICKTPPPSDVASVGILVRQKTASEVKGGMLRDAQREAYERQMLKEPGCTCCIILAGSEMDKSQVRIVELWKTMDDFYFHENSEWHARGEEKVVPLVVDMDCDFVKGYQVLS